MTRAAFVTIVTRSHFAHAKVAMASVVSREILIKRFIYVIGATSFRPSADDDVEVLHVEEVIDPALVNNIVHRYTAAETCFALKPTVMAQLIDRGFARVHYIDSDICFYSDAALIDAALRDHDILLTPHYLDPYPLVPSHRRSVLTLLRAGVFNAGYVGTRDSAAGKRFLDWWQTLVQLDCENDPRRGVCGDQRWLDLVPSLFPSAAIWRARGANVAYWNIHERELRLTGGSIKCRDSDLLFFHFSGFDPDRPDRLSVYQTGAKATENAALRKLLSEYADKLKAASYSGHRKIRYRYERWWHRNGGALHLFKRWIRKRKRMKAYGR